MPSANEKAVGSLSAGGFQIQFRRERDRYRHSVFGLVESLDDTSEEVWPASPPLQSLLIEQRPNDVQVALLVGMAGTSHWSLSVELDPHGRTATFDVACRVKRGPAVLRTSYAIVNRLDASPAADAAASLILSRGVAFQSLPVDDIPPARLHLDPAGKTLSVVPVVEGFALPHTFRWRYQFLWQDDR